MNNQQAWWKETSIYHIYPRSFMDCNGDGIGDIEGIRSRLDYIHSLGVGMIWMSPIYLSPDADNGYDISDYDVIDPKYGTIEQFKQLVNGIHDRGMKLMMDLVLNHTSDEHPWFQQSREPESPYRDYYYWRSGRDGRPPNNWVSVFGGPAWTKDEGTGDYYLHLFGRKQPDLNWNNPQVRAELIAMAKRWLALGVDGFRMDVINYISKDERLPDADGGELAWGGHYFVNGPHIHNYLQQFMQETGLTNPQYVTVGETPGVSVEEAKRYTGHDRKELHLLFQFEHMELDQGHGKWDIRPMSFPALKRNFEKWQHGLRDYAWNSLYWSNHDQPRTVSRFGTEGVYRERSAKLLALMLHSHQGTPFIFQGEEIGMTNAGFTSLASYRDIESLRWIDARTAAGDVTEEYMLHALQHKSRDNARTPIQWDSSRQAGFTSGEPWIPVNSNYTLINVEQAEQNPASILHFYRRLIALRQAEPTIVYGDFLLHEADHPHLWLITRQLGDTLLVSVANCSDLPLSFLMPEQVVGEQPSVLLLSTVHESEQRVIPYELNHLDPYEARIYRFNLVSL